MNKIYLPLLISVVSGMALSINAAAQEKDSSDLAQELTNPIADLMTIPIQVNVDRNIGLNDEGRKTTINIQPVVPFKVAEGWNIDYPNHRAVSKAERYCSRAGLTVRPWRYH